MSSPRKADLDQLITALTADGRPEELAGRDAALAAFRGARQRNAAGKAAPRRRGVPLRRPHNGFSARVAAIGAALLVAAGAAAAAYAQALPGPVQQLAHTVFAPLGVPSGQRQPAPAGITIARTGGKSDKGAAKTPSPRPGTDYLITVGVSRARVRAGGVVVFTGRVTDHGRAVARVRIRLLARAAGATRFELVTAAETGALGRFRLSSPPLTATTVFRVAAPDGAHSLPVTVAVVAPRITAHADGGALGPAATE